MSPLDIRNPGANVQHPHIPLPRPGGIKTNTPFKCYITKKKKKKIFFFDIVSDEKEEQKSNVKKKSAEHLMIMMIQYCYGITDSNEFTLSNLMFHALRLKRELKLLNEWIKMRF